MKVGGDSCRISFSHGFDCRLEWYLSSKDCFFGMLFPSIREVSRESFGQKC